MGLKKAFIFVVSLLLLLILTNARQVFNYVSNQQGYSGLMTIMYTDSNAITHYCSYDIITKITKEVYQRKNNNEYPTGVITKDGNTLYYTAKTSATMAPDLFKMDLSNKMSEQLTKGIYIDLFHLGNNKLFIKAQKKANRNFKVLTYDLRNSQCNIWDENDADLNTYNLYYNQFNHKVYAIQRSIKEQDSTEVPLHKITEYDENGNKIKLLFSTREFVHDISVSKEGNIALVSSVSYNTNTPISSIYLINLGTAKVKTIMRSNGDSYVIKQPLFSPDEKGFYFLAITPTSKTVCYEANKPVKARGVYYYSFKTKTIKKVFEQENGTVNNYDIQY